MAELPHLVEVHERYAGKGLVILYVSRDKNPEALERFARRRALPFPVFFDLSGEAAKPFVDKDGQLVVPTTVLFDPDHRILLTESGFTPEQFARLETAIRRALPHAERK